MRKNLYVLFALLMVASMLLAACGPTPTVPPTEPPPPPATEEPTAVADLPTNTPEPVMDEATPTAEAPTVTPTLTPYPTKPAPVGAVVVRWFIGLGTGTDPVQLTAEQAVVDDFNAAPERATDKIFLQMEVVPYASAKDTILTQIAAGNGPDVIGPVGWNGSSALYGQWADLKAEIAAIPDVTKDFDPALLKSYESSEGTVGLPFAVFPSVIFYNATLFEEAGINPPPAKYGEKYDMDGKMVDWNWDTVKTVSQMLTVDANGANATEAGFDKTKIVQYGFSWNFEGQPSYVGAFQCNGGQFTDPKDINKAQIPDCWKDAWKWTYDGVWGDKPFIPNGQVAGSADFGNGNPFNSGKVGMIDQPLWYTCCMGDVKAWEAGALPSGKTGVAGRIDADTFRIWKGTKNKAAAFKVLTYLVTTGVQKLIIGSADMPPAYGALPARTKDFDAWLAAKKTQFPWVKNWDLFKEGLKYPDTPSAEAYMPNYNEAWARTGTFYSLMLNTGGLNLDTEIATLLTDLQAIFDKAPVK
jgi:multiple sugar transport system substrate-binding protein